MPYACCPLALFLDGSGHFLCIEVVDNNQKWERSLELHNYSRDAWWSAGVSVDCVVGCGAGANLEDTAAELTTGLNLRGACLPAGGLAPYPHFARPPCRPATCGWPRLCPGMRPGT